MRIAADVGGTFTDVFFADERGTRGTYGTRGETAHVPGLRGGDYDSDARSGRQLQHVAELRGQALHQQHVAQLFQSIKHRRTPGHRADAYEG